MLKRQIVVDITVGKYCVLLNITLLGPAPDPVALLRRGLEREELAVDCTIVLLCLAEQRGLGLAPAGGDVWWCHYI
jgi:hypothetical protein